LRTLMDRVPDGAPAERQRAEPRAEHAVVVASSGWNVAATWLPARRPGAAHAPAPRYPGPPA
jgi:hypothetical protein